LVTGFGLGLELAVREPIPGASEMRLLLSLAADTDERAHTHDVSALDTFMIKRIYTTQYKASSRACAISWRH